MEVKKVFVTKTDWKLGFKFRREVLTSTPARNPNPTANTAPNRPQTHLLHHAVEARVPWLAPEVGDLASVVTLEVGEHGHI